jgi:hypothetical protein
MKVEFFIERLNDTNEVFEFPDGTPSQVIQKSFEDWLGNFVSSGWNQVNEKGEVE